MEHELKYSIHPKLFIGTLLCEARNLNIASDNTDIGCYVFRCCSGLDVVVILFQWPQLLEMCLHLIYPGITQFMTLELHFVQGFTREQIE